MGLQGVVVEFANGPSGCVRLGWKEWAACFLTAMVSLGIDWSVKCIWGLIAERLIRSFSPPNRFTRTPSAPRECHSHLELPVMRVALQDLRGEESTTFPF